MGDLEFFDKISHEFDLLEKMRESDGSKYYRDYIDYLEQDEVPKNTMRGSDFWGRKFIILKVGIKNTKTDKLEKTGQVFFQRYSNSGSIWAGADFEGEFLIVGGGVCREQFSLLNDIVSGRKVVLNETHKCKKKYKGHIIASMDVWEKEAVNCIKRNWLVAYYNPRYTLRKNILNRQFDEYLKQVE